MQPFTERGPAETTCTSREAPVHWASRLGTPCQSAAHTHTRLPCSPAGDNSRTSKRDVANNKQVARQHEQASSPRVPHHACILLLLNPKTVKLNVPVTARMSQHAPHERQQVTFLHFAPELLTSCLGPRSWVHAFIRSLIPQQQLPLCSLLIHPCIRI